MSLIDFIVVFAIGVFIFSRFFSHNMPKDKKLPKKVGSTVSRAKSTQRVVDFPKTPEVTAADEPAGLAEVRKAMTDFRIATFLNGTKKAYTYYYDKWNAKDDDALAQLASPQLLDKLIGQLDELDAKNHSPQVKVEKIENLQVVEARLNGKTAILDVQIVAKQSENIVDDKGKIVGKEQQPKKITQVWTFARPVGTDDPNWELEDIQPVN